MAASWIAHVKETHKKLGGSYKDALKAASKTWKKKGAAAAKPAKRGRKKAAAEEEEVDEKEEAPAPKRRRKKKAKSKKQPLEGPGPLVPKRRRPGVPKGYRNIN